MGRILTALDRYKQQYPKGKTVAPADRPAGAQGPSAGIVYSRTRSENVLLSVLRENRVLAAFEEGPYTDAYKILRTQVMHRMRENAWSVLAVTSPGEGEGKTLTAVNLAVSLALEVTQTVLLVDANLRAPSVHHAFGLMEQRGLSDYLLHDTPIEDLLVHPGIRRFVLLPGGRRIQNSVELLTSPRMVALVKELKQRYPSRIVIFDLPPLNRAADVLAFSPYVDATLMVVEEGRTTVADVERALLLLKGATPVIGTVLNKAGRLNAPPAPGGHPRSAL
ncbi:MAG TPA: CpsD/CapB family tyrosine-protein kinase, partial [Nitrospirales bacterium]|nr:CpsD/CapB family tyrosine-protein kinase [Nitrospirales bacterium]